MTDEQAAYARAWADGYKAGHSAGSGAVCPLHSSNMQTILRTIAGRGLLWEIDEQGHKVEQVRPGGRILTSPEADQYELYLWGEGTAAALGAICGDIAQALGVEWARVDRDPTGEDRRAFVVIPHQIRGAIPQG